MESYKCIRWFGCAVLVVLFGPAISSAVLIPADSSSFPFKYEGDQVPATTANATNYTRFQDGPVAGPSTDGNILSYTSTGFGTYMYLQSDLWPSNTSGNVGWTIEARIKIGTNETDESLGAFWLFAGDGLRRQALAIKRGSSGYLYNASGVEGYYQFDGQSNTDTFHVFRMAREANSPFINIWRDGVLFTSSVPISASDVMYFGDGSNVGNVVGGPTVQIDYVRFTGDGAFSPTPVPEPSGGILIGIAICGLFSLIQHRNYSFIKTGYHD